MSALGGLRYVGSKWPHCQRLPSISDFFVGTSRDFFGASSSHPLGTVLQNSVQQPRNKGVAPECLAVKRLRNCESFGVAGPRDFRSEMPWL